MAALRAEWELSRGNPTNALQAIENALSIVRLESGFPAQEYPGIRALSLARLGQTAEAREVLEEAVDSWTGRLPSFLYSPRRPGWPSATERKAREFVRRAYPLAWADGPPYIHWHELNRCRELMSSLGETEPQLPAFDPAKVEPIPYEAEIRTLIEKEPGRHSPRRGMT